MRHAWVQEAACLVHKGPAARNGDRQFFGPQCWISYHTSTMSWSLCHPDLLCLVLKRPAAWKADISCLSRTQRTCSKKRGQTNSPTLHPPCLGSRATLSCFVSCSSNPQREKRYFLTHDASLAGLLRAARLGEWTAWVQQLFFPPTIYYLQGCSEQLEGFDSTGTP